MKILETDRLTLREITRDDAGFILDLLNQPSFIKFIGDRNVRSIEQSAEYIENRLTASYRENGFGMYLVKLKSEFGNPKFQIESIGICGFVKRDSLPDPDIGFAFLPQYEKKGYAFESAAAVMKFGRESLNFSRVLAITTRDNQGSVKLLEKLGFRFERLIKMPDDDAELNLFSAELN